MNTIDTKLASSNQSPFQNPIVIAKTQAKAVATRKLGSSKAWMPASAGMTKIYVANR